MFVCFTLLNQFLKEFNEYFIVQKQFLKKTIAYTGAIQQWQIHQIVDENPLCKYSIPKITPFYFPRVNVVN